MGARLRASHEQALATGWYAANFARGKLKPLSEYLDRRSDEQRADDGASRVLALLKRLHNEQKQEAAGGTG